MGFVKNCSQQKKCVEICCDSCEADDEKGCSDDCSRPACCKPGCSPKKPCVTCIKCGVAPELCRKPPKRTNILSKSCCKEGCVPACGNIESKNRTIKIKSKCVIEKDQGDCENNNREMDVKITINGKETRCKARCEPEPEPCCPEPKCRESHPCKLSCKEPAPCKPNCSEPKCKEPNACKPKPPCEEPCPKGPSRFPRACRKVTLCSCGGCVSKKANCAKQACKPSCTPADPCKEPDCVEPQCCAPACCPTDPCKKPNCPQPQCCVIICTPTDPCRKPDCPKSQCYMAACTPIDPCKKPECSKPQCCKPACCPTNPCKKPDCPKPQCLMPACSSFNPCNLPTCNNPQCCARHSNNPSFYATSSVNNFQQSMPAPPSNYFMPNMTKCWSNPVPCPCGMPTCKNSLMIYP